MKQKSKNEFFQLFIVVMMVVGLFFSFALLPSAHGASKFPVTLENCQPGTWVGMVQWVNNKTEYKQLPDAEIKQTGSITVMLEPGKYAITHFRPASVTTLSDGRYIFKPNAFVEFREVEITGPVTLSFGCEE